MTIFHNFHVLWGAPSFVLRTWYEAPVATVPTLGSTGVMLPTVRTNANNVQFVLVFGKLILQKDLVDDMDVQIICKMSSRFDLRACRMRWWSDTELAFAQLLVEARNNWIKWNKCMFELLWILNLFTVTVSCIALTCRKVSYFVFDSYASYAPFSRQELEIGLYDSRNFPKDLELAPAQLWEDYHFACTLVKNSRVKKPDRISKVR